MKNMVDILQKQRDFSVKTFGPAPRLAGIIDHIRKELIEIEQSPNDLSEWVDVVILALDGAMRAGYSPERVVKGILNKIKKNESREWPDWQTVPTDKAIEHIKTH